MNNKRQVDFRILFNLLKGKRGMALIGIVFTSLSIFVFIPLIIILSATLKAPYEKYDFEKITKNGVEKDAKITAINTVRNVSINYDHPKIISYAYENNGQTIQDKFETIDLDKIADFNIGTGIKILAYENQSAIKGLKPFTFPIELFYLLPGVFLLVGIAFMLVGLIPALRTFNLYKTGIVKDAYIVSMAPNTGGLLVRGFQPNILVNYYYSDQFGNKVFGQSTTADFLILNEKKAGDKVKIFVSEKDETKSCLVPKLEAMKYNWDV
jgi:hypothetical protein